MLIWGLSPGQGFPEGVEPGSTVGVVAWYRDGFFVEIHSRKQGCFGQVLIIFIAVM